MHPKDPAVPSDAPLQTTAEIAGLQVYVRCRCFQNTALGPVCLSGGSSCPSVWRQAVCLPQGRGLAQPRGSCVMGRPGDPPSHFPFPIPYLLHKSAKNMTAISTHRVCPGILQRELPGPAEDRERRALWGQPSTHLTGSPTTMSGKACCGAAAQPSPETRTRNEV